MHNPQIKRTVSLNGTRLVELRSQHGWSQATLAHRAGISDDTVSRAERGRPIRLFFAKVIAETLDVPPKDLLLHSAEPSHKYSQLVDQYFYEPFVRHYENGIIVQKLDINIPPNMGTLFVVYPIAFANEVLSIQSIGVEAMPHEITLANCLLAFSPAPAARNAHLIPSGL
jgi:transcriptional regulator with XRE-family HTH domain